MASILAFKKISKRNNFPALNNAVARAMDPRGSIVYHTTRFAARKIKTLQRKAPKKPRIFKGDDTKTLYGVRATYKPTTKKFQQGKRSYAKKGLYSKPGSPPFWHQKSSNPFQTMRIIASFDVKGYALAWTNLYAGAGDIKDIKVVGPAIRWNMRRGKPVPILHEQGGTVRIGRGQPTYLNRNGAEIMRKSPATAVYPARPFVGPGGAMGAREAWTKYSESKLTRIWGMKPKSVVKMRKVA